MIKCKKIIEQDGQYWMGYLVPDGKSVRSAIIIIAAYTEAKAGEKLEVAIKEMPDKLKSKYEI